MDGMGMVVRRSPLRAPASPVVLLQTEILTFRDRTHEGVLVASVADTWLELYRAIEKDPEFLQHFSRNPRKFEEFIAGAYNRAGWDEVILTPRSGDGGRDVIAVKRGFGSVRFLEQTKAYHPGHLVTHDDVRAMIGVLSTDPNSSKGLITTTSDFQPTIRSSPEFQRFLPHRLELKNGTELMEWLKTIQKIKLRYCAPRPAFEAAEARKMRLQRVSRATRV